MLGLRGIILFTYLRVMIHFLFAKRLGLGHFSSFKKKEFGNQVVINFKLVLLIHFLSGSNVLLYQVLNECGLYQRIT